MANDLLSSLVGSGLLYADGKMRSASQVVYARQSGVVADGSTDCTAPLVAAMASAGPGGTVVLPTGPIMVDPFAVPDWVTLLGEAGSRRYTGTPQEGAVLTRRSGAAEPLISLGTGSRLGRFSAVGAGTAEADGDLVLLSDSNVLDDLNLSGGCLAVNGAFGGNNSVLSRLWVHENAVAISDLVDTAVDLCVLNANLYQGIYLGSGCNLNRFSNLRVEWNGTNNVECDTGSANNTFSLVQTDGAGWNNFRLNGAEVTSLTGCSAGRAGRKVGDGDTIAGSERDANYFIAGCTGTAIGGASTSWCGPDDDGQGYVGAYYAVYDGGGNSNCLIRGNVLAFHGNSTTAVSTAINTGSGFPNLATDNVAFWS